MQLTQIFSLIKKVMEEKLSIHSEQNKNSGLLRALLEKVRGIEK